MNEAGGYFMRTLNCVAVLSLSAWLVLAAVPSSADSPFSYALIRPSCAPWDGAAIEVTLAKEPLKCDRTDGPSLAIGVWKGLPLHDGQEVKVDSISSVGFATQCAKAGDCERAESGKIIFDKILQGSSASGHYELHFKGGRTLTGNFDAKWCNDRVVCG
jgi:hypothetical protein